jgi:hypothetical protein
MMMTDLIAYRNGRPTAGRNIGPAAVNALLLQSPLRLERQLRRAYFFFSSGFFLSSAFAAALLASDGGGAASVRSIFAVSCNFCTTSD